MVQTFTTAAATIRKTAEILPDLHDRALNLMRARKSSPVAIYLSLIQEVPGVDLRTEEALAVRTRFNGFYGVRRNAAWRAEFYGHFEAMKQAPGTAEARFGACLRALHTATGRVEASFVSKAVATFHPASPVIDKVLRDRFASLVTPPPFGGGVEPALSYYRWLADVMEGLTRTPQAADWFRVYDVVFVDTPGAATTHPVKKLDFLIWGGRPDKPSPKPRAPPKGAAA
jgi:hypothetical protein